MAPIREQGANIASIKASSLRAVQRADFEAALTEVRPSVSEEHMRSLDAWAQQFGTRA
jgi:fidgetin-like protein 1